jgi:AraC-like DNA-binding protein
VRRHFAAAFGCPPLAYLTLRHMRPPERLLANGSSSVTEVPG